MYAWMKMREKPTRIACTGKFIQREKPPHTKDYSLRMLSHFSADSTCKKPFFMKFIIYEKYSADLVTVDEELSNSNIKWFFKDIKKVISRKIIQKKNKEFE